MPVNRKRWTKVCVIGNIAVVVVALFLLVAVSSRCSVMSRDTIMSPSDSNLSNTCTVDVFRNYYRTKDYFPGEGRWNSRRPNHSESGMLYRFVPDLCKFHFDGFQSLPGDSVGRCLRRRNVTRIMTVGDSNAARYYGALLTTLRGYDTSWECVNVTTEQIDRTMLLPDVRYFARHDRRLLALLSATTRHCSSCVSSVHRCRRRRQASNDELVWLEHVSMVSVLDSSVKIDVPHNHFVINLRYRADTFQVLNITTFHSVAC